jgi:predicted metal-binding membrane protein
MMSGMMIPSAAPMVLTHAAMLRRRVAQGAPFVSSGLFLAGYLLAWSGFSAVAALEQSALYHTNLLDSVAGAKEVYVVVRQVMEERHARNDVGFGEWRIWSRKKDANHPHVS